MNPLIVLEKKYIHRFNFGGAVLIAFLKEKGGEYHGSLNDLSTELGVMTKTGVIKAEKKLEKIGVINAERNKIKQYKYILNEEVLQNVEKCMNPEKKKPKKKYSPKYGYEHKIPQKVKDLVDKIQEIRENKDKK